MSFTREDWKAAERAVAAIEAERRVLLEPTEARYAAACERLEDIEDDLSDMISRCEGCSEPIFDGDPYLGDAEASIYQCKSCAPTYADMLSGHKNWESHETGEPMTKAEAQAWVDRHIEAGGSITDSIAR